ncbi:MAG: MerR family transcriptional regulator, partial [Bacteroidetes bacterium]|nr:MerR family transcriptional regulator [Bacteroidota bacterium]
KAHTIRIWEKRHQLIEPQRTKTNIRYYSDDDLKKIINVSVLNNNGVKISRIVQLSLNEINQQVADLSEKENSIDIYIEQLIVALVDMDEEQFERMLGQLTIKFGFEKMILEIIYPFLEKIGVLWLTNNITPAQEHFITHLIRQKMIVAIDALPLAPKESTKAILFLPENELHELSLLFYYYIVKKKGIRTYYLGQTVPYSSLKSIFEVHKPQLVITSFTTHPRASELQKYVDKLCADCGSAKILATGYALKKTTVSAPSNLVLFANALELSQLV